MKCTIPEISWHNREPVLSVDIHPVSNDSYKLASGGGDSHILIWQMILCENGSVKQELISDLTRHQRSVNTVRWSSTGQYLASADDDGNIIVWQMKTDNIPLLESNSEDKEVWLVYKILRGHKEDIYDLCWSTDNLKLLSGSVDNTAIVWDLTKGKLDQILSDHKGFVQGVAWDPEDQFLATISTDRICRIFNKAGKVKARICKGKLPVPSDHFLFDKESKYFHDDTFKSFYRRLQFTPDGSLLLVPSGHFQPDDCKRILNSTLVFTMDNWTEPAAVLPLEKQSSTVVRCCPALFQLREEGPDPLVILPYRIIFAIGTDHDIILYDTQQSTPFARFHEIHYTRITDLTWSKDGLLLVASSTDGFCSIITFEPEELGPEYVKGESDEETATLEVNESLELDKDENVDVTNKVIKVPEEAKKKPSFIRQWAQTTPKKPKIKANDIKNNINGQVEDKTPDEKINKITPRRITPRKVGETKQLRDSEVIEIDDEDHETDELSKEIKDDIKKLIPRRITPKKVGECSKNGTVAKPIEVRRKPRDVNVTSIPVKRKLIEDTIQTKDEDNVGKTNTIDSINLNNLKQIEPGNLNRIENKIILDNCNEDGVKKLKPKEDQEYIEQVVTKNNNKKDSMEVDTPNLLEQDKEAKTSTETQSISIPKSRMEQKSLSVSKSLDAESLHTPAKVTETCKPRSASAKKKDLSKIKVDSLVRKKEGKKDSDQDVTKNNKKDSMEVDIPNSLETSTIDEVKKAKTLTETQSRMVQESVSVLKSPDAESLHTPPKVAETCKPRSASAQKKDLPKLKVGSLVRKKLNTTPNKSNPLLNFLKKSGEKSKKSKAEPSVTANINLSIGEEEAMDGFSKKITEKKNHTNSSPDAIPLDEDCTEDFCLQLEDTQLEVEKKVEHAGMDVDIIKEEKQVVEVIQISDDSCSPKKKIEESMVQKKPRRVPLITLSSPKGKKNPPPATVSTVRE